MAEETNWTGRIPNQHGAESPPERSFVHPVLAWALTISAFLVVLGLYIYFR